MVLTYIQMLRMVPLISTPPNLRSNTAYTHEGSCPAFGYIMITSNYAARASEGGAHTVHHLRCLTLELNC